MKKCLAQMILYLKKNLFDGTRTLSEAVTLLERQIKEQGFEGFIQGQMTGNLAMPRKQELYAALNRCRELIQIVKKNSGR